MKEYQISIIEMTHEIPYDYSGICIKDTVITLSKPPVDLAYALAKADKYDYSDLFYVSLEIWVFTLIVLLVKYFTKYKNNKEIKQ